MVPNSLAAGIKNLFIDHPIANTATPSPSKLFPTPTISTLPTTRPKMATDPIMPIKTSSPLSKSS